jgi:hypothetical protein
MGLDMRLRGELIVGIVGVDYPVDSSVQSIQLCAAFLSCVSSVSWLMLMFSDCPPSMDRRPTTGLLHLTATSWCGLKLPQLGHVGATVRVSTTKHTKHTKKRQNLETVRGRYVRIRLRG